MKRHLLAAALFFLAASNAAAQTDAETWKVVTTNVNASRQSCILELKKGLLRKQDDVSLITPSLADFATDLKFRAAHLALVGMNEISEGSPFRIMREPFAFRDTAHFSAFTESALFAEMADAEAKRSGLRVVSAAYATQSLLLSRAMALLEPEHFAEPIPGSAAKPKIASAASPSDGWATWLGAQESFSRPLERLAALLSGTVDAAVLPPVFQQNPNMAKTALFIHRPAIVMDIDVFIFDAKLWDGLTSAMREELRRWLVATAAACSAANLARDDADYRALLAAGVKPLAMNAEAIRASLAPKMSAIPKNPWTQAQWDRLQAIR